MKSRPKKWPWMAYGLPLFLLMIIIAYGLLKIDFGDTEDKTPYGWIYTLFLFIPLWAASGFSWLLAMNVAISRKKSESLLTNSLELLLTLLGGGLFLWKGLSVVLFNIAIKDDPTLWSYVVTCVSLPMVAMGRRFNLIRSGKVWQLGIPIILLILSPLGYVGVKNVQTNLNLKHEITAYYKQIDPQLSYTFKGYHEEISTADIILKDHNVRLPVTVQFDKALHVSSSSYISPKKGFPTLVSYTASTKEGKNLLKRFKKVVNLSLKKEYSDIQVDTDDNDLGYGVVKLKSPKRIKNLANQNLENPKKLAFGGYTSIPAKDYVQEGVLVPYLRVDDVYKKSEFNPTDQFYQSIDFSSLPDGHYVIDGAILSVKNGKFTETIDNNIANYYPDWVDVAPFQVDSWNDGGHMFALDKPVIEQPSKPKDTVDNETSQAQTELTDQQKADISKVIQAYYKKQHQDYQVVVVGRGDDPNTYRAYLEQGEIRVPVEMTIDGETVLNTTFTGKLEGYEVSVALRTLASQEYMQTYRSQYQLVLTEALSQSGYGDKVTPFPEESYFADSSKIAFYRLNNQVKTYMKANQSNSDPTISAFQGIGGISAETMLKEEVLVPKINVDIDDSLKQGDTLEEMSKNSHKVLDDVIGHMDASSLSDGLYQLSGRVFRVQSGQITIVKEIESIDTVDLLSPDSFDYLTKDDWDHRYLGS